MQTVRAPQAHTTTSAFLTLVHSHIRNFLCEIKNNKKVRSGEGLNSMNLV